MLSYTLKTRLSAVNPAPTNSYFNHTEPSVLEASPHFHIFPQAVFTSRNILPNALPSYPGTHRSPHSGNQQKYRLSFCCVQYGVGMGEGTKRQRLWLDRRRAIPSNQYRHTHTRTHAHNHPPGLADSPLLVILPLSPVAKLDSTFKP